MKLKNSLIALGLNLALFPSWVWGIPTSPDKQTKPSLVPFSGTQNPAPTNHLEIPYHESAMANQLIRTGRVGNFRSLFDSAISIVGLYAPKNKPNVFNSSGLTFPRFEFFVATTTELKDVFGKEKFEQNIASFIDTPMFLNLSRDPNEAKRVNIFVFLDLIYWSAPMSDVATVEFRDDGVEVLIMTLGRAILGSIGFLAGRNIDTYKDAESSQLRLKFETSATIGLLQNLADHYVIEPGAKELDGTLMSLERREAHQTIMRARFQKLLRDEEEREATLK